MSIFENLSQGLYGLFETGQEINREEKLDEVENLFKKYITDHHLEGHYTILKEHIKNVPPFVVFFREEDKKMRDVIFRVFYYPNGRQAYFDIEDYSRGADRGIAETIEKAYKILGKHYPSNPMKF